jgi:hypothetical protein
MSRIGFRTWPPSSLLRVDSSYAPASEESGVRTRPKTVLTRTFVRSCSQSLTTAVRPSGCDTRSHGYEWLADWRVEHVGDREFRVSVRGPVPTLTCFAGNGGVRSIRGNAQGRPLHPGATGKGKAGRVNASELSLMPRHRNPRGWDVAPRAGLAAEMRQRRPVTRSRSCEHRGPGVQRAPSPVGSRPCGTWKPPSGSGRRSGKPTVRKAQLPGGTGWSKKRMPVAERRQESETAGRSFQRPFRMTGRTQARCLARKGADVDQVSL